MRAPRSILVPILVVLASFPEIGVVEWVAVSVLAGLWSQAHGVRARSIAIISSSAPLLAGVEVATLAVVV